MCSEGDELTHPSWLVVKGMIEEAVRGNDV